MNNNNNNKWHQVNVLLPLQQEQLQRQVQWIHEQLSLDIFCLKTLELNVVCYTTEMNNNNNNIKYIPCYHYSNTCKDKYTGYMNQLSSDIFCVKTLELNVLCIMNAEMKRLKEIEEDISDALTITYE